MGFSLSHLLIVLLIILLLFGARRLRTLGSDLGGAVKGFRDAMGESKDEEPSAKIQPPPQAGSSIEGQGVTKESGKDPS